MADNVYCDSSTFLAWFKNEENRADTMAYHFDRCAHDGAKIVTSAFTIVEVLNLRGAGHPIPKSDRDKVRNLFLNDWIIVKNVNRRIAEVAQEVVWDFGIKPKDSMHVATALVYKVPKLYAYDAGLTKKTVSTSYGDILMCEPERPAQLEMSLA